MDIKIPFQVSYILQTLEKNNYKGYIVGGCVRDALLKKTPRDWDIATNAKPREIFSLFSSLHPKQANIDFGAVSVLLDGTSYEISTFRKEEGTIDHRRPNLVYFVDNILEDLLRRDFTINAIAYNPKDGIIDPFGGVDDLKAGLIRSIGDPHLRFWEDCSRILRALRFSARYKFKIDCSTQQAISKQSSLLSNLSAEQFLSEAISLLCEDNFTFAVFSSPHPIFEWIPELFFSESIFYKQKIAKTPFFQGVLAAKVSPTLPELRLSLLLHPLVKNSFDPSDKNEYKKIAVILDRLKVSRILKNKILFLLSHKYINPPNSKKDCLYWLCDFGSEDALKLIEFRRSIEYVKPHNISRVHQWDRAERQLNEIINNSSCWSLNQLAINGSDLIAIGIPSGKNIAIILKRLLNLVIEEELDNSKPTLLIEALKYIESGKS